MYLFYPLRIKKGREGRERKGGERKGRERKGRKGKGKREGGRKEGHLESCKNVFVFVYYAS